MAGVEGKKSLAGQYIDMRDRIRAMIASAPVYRRWRRRDLWVMRRCVVTAFREDVDKADKKASGGEEEGKGREGAKAKETVGDQEEQAKGLGDGEEERNGSVCTG